MGFMPHAEPSDREGAIAPVTSASVPVGLDDDPEHARHVDVERRTEVALIVDEATIRTSHDQGRLDAHDVRVSRKRERRREDASVENTQRVAVHLTRTVHERVQQRLREVPERERRVGSTSGEEDEAGTARQVEALADVPSGGLTTEHPVDVATHREIAPAEDQLERRSTRTRHRAREKSAEQTARPHPKVEAPRERLEGVETSLVRREGRVDGLPSPVLEGRHTIPELCEAVHHLIGELAERQLRTVRKDDQRGLGVDPTTPCGRGDAILTDLVGRSSRVVGGATEDPEHHLLEEGDPLVARVIRDLVLPAKGVRSRKARLDVAVRAHAHGATLTTIPANGDAVDLLEAVVVRIVSVRVERIGALAGRAVRHRVADADRGVDLSTRRAARAPRAAATACAAPAVRIAVGELAVLRVARVAHAHHANVGCVAETGSGVERRRLEHLAVVVDVLLRGVTHAGIVARLCRGSRHADESHGRDERDREDVLLHDEPRRVRVTKLGTGSRASARPEMRSISNRNVCLTSFHW